MKINIEYRENHSINDPAEYVKTRLHNIRGLTIESIVVGKSDNDFFAKRKIVVAARHEMMLEPQLGRVCRDIREALSLHGDLTLESIYDGRNNVTQLNPMPPLSPADLKLFNSPNAIPVNSSKSNGGIELEFKIKEEDELKGEDWQKMIEPVVLAIIQKIKESRRGIHSCVQPNHFIYRIEHEVKVFRIKAVGVGFPNDRDRALKEIVNNVNCVLALIPAAQNLQLTSITSDSFYFEKEPSWQFKVIYKAVLGCFLHEQKVLALLSKVELETKLGKAFLEKHHNNLEWELDEAHHSVILRSGCFPISYVASFFGKKLVGCDVEYLPAENKEGNVYLKVNHIDPATFAPVAKIGNTQ